MERNLHGAFEGSGRRVKNLTASRSRAKIIAAITEALEEDHGRDRAREVAFHLSDWIADAAFLVALHLYPERFSKKEIDDGILAFLIHAPAHVMAAARIAKAPLTDTFELGIKVDS